MRRPPRSLLLVLVAVLVAAVAALVGLVATAPTDDGPAPVLADTGTPYRPGTLPDDLTTAVTAATTALPLALGYDYRSLPRGLRAATELMTEDFAAEFRRTFEASAADLARRQQAVTTATARAGGVVRVEDWRVLCLVYVDQALVSDTTVRNADAPVRIGQNRVLVGMVQEDGDWKVDSIAPF